MGIEHAVGKGLYDALWYEVTDGCSQTDIKRAINLYASQKL